MGFHGAKAEVDTYPMGRLHTQSHRVMLLAALGPRPQPVIAFICLLSALVIWEDETPLRTEDMHQPVTAPITETFCGPSIS